jgi:hypothetical protein
MIKEYNPKYKREKSRDKFEKIKSEMEKKFEEEHSFKPNVNYANIFTAVDRSPESKEEFYKRLSTPKIVDISKKMKEKEIQEIQKQSEICTFKPNINSSNAMVENTTKNESEVVTNRLYKLAEQMKEKREKLKREYQDNIIKDYSFKPEIDQNSKQLLLKYEKKPLHERVLY